jgi:hypothetical protein
MGLMLMLASFSRGARHRRLGATHRDIYRRWSLLSLFPAFEGKEGVYLCSRTVLRLGA